MLLLGEGLIVKVSSITTQLASVSAQNGASFSNQNKLSASFCFRLGRGSVCSIRQDFDRWRYLQAVQMSRHSSLLLDFLLLSWGSGSAFGVSA